MSLWQRLLGAKETRETKAKAPQPLAGSPKPAPWSQPAPTAPAETIVPQGASAASSDQATFQDAVKRGDLETVEALLRDSPDLVLRNDKDGDTPLHQAAKEGRTEVAALLLERGAKADVKGKWDYTPLHYAASRRMAELLIGHGAELNTISQGGETPLHKAAANCREDVIELLLSRGAEVNIKDSDGWAPLHWAVEREHQPIVELLLAYGADVNANQRSGDTPLQVATKWTRREKLAELLRAHGAKASARGGAAGLANLLEATCAGTILKEIQEEFTSAKLEASYGQIVTGLNKNSEAMWLRAYTKVADKLCVKYGLTPEQFAALFKKATHLN